jgi:hypothetical protein
MATRREQEITTMMVTVNTFHKNSLPDNIVHGLKTINLASNPYICDCNLIWFIKWLNNTKIIIQEYPNSYCDDHS